MLPDALAKESQDVAHKLGISRTQFIRQAIAHELENYAARLEQEAILKTISAMKKDKKYIEESKKITEEMNSDLPNDGDDWWSKKKS
jgi:metal-responsive CopG/Arc/MetJ family transcriptional regulator